MNDIVQMANPYGEGREVAPRGGNSVVGNSDAQRVVAEVQGALTVARMNPRDERRAMDKILNTCQLPRLAERAIYSYARGGTDIEGPSIHLARALARNWGNLSFGIREMERSDGYSVVQAFAWDQETNVREERVFTVPHSIGLKGGRTKQLTDERDIYELIANMGARRERACILGLLPDDVVEGAVDQCNATLRAKADVSAEAVQKMVVAFQDEFGVTKAQLEARYQRRIDTIQPAQMVALKKIYRSLRDDMSKPEDWFDPIEAGEEDKSQPTSGNDAAKEAARKAAENAKKNPPKKDPPAKEDQEPEATFKQIAKPEGAKRHDTWWHPENKVLKFAHDKGPHGIKWYVAKQSDEDFAASQPPAEEKPAEAEGAQQNETDGAAEIPVEEGQEEGEARAAEESSDEPEWLMRLNSLKAQLETSDTPAAVQQVDVVWLNTVRNSVPDEALVQAFDREIAQAMKDAKRGEG